MSAPAPVSVYVPETKLAEPAKPTVAASPMSPCAKGAGRADAVSESVMTDADGEEPTSAITRY